MQWTDPLTNELMLKQLMLKQLTVENPASIH